MFAKIASLMKQSAVYGIGAIAARAVAFLLLPYYSHLLSPAEYGIYALFMVLVTIVQPLYIHGMDIALLRFSADTDEAQQRRDLGTTLLHTLGVGGTLSLLMLLLADPLAKLVVSGAGPLEATLVRMIAGVLLLDSLAYHIFTWLRIRRRPVAFSLVKMLNVVVNIGLNIAFVGVMGLGVAGAFWAFLGTSAVVFVALLILARQALRPSWRWPVIRSWLAFGLPNLPSQLFFVMVEFSDRKWIEHYLGLEQAGIYAAGYRIAMVMAMIAQAFRYAWQPFFLQTARDVDARETFARVLTYYLLFTGWVWLAGSWLLPPLLKLPLPGIGPLIAPGYWAGFAVLPIILFAHIFNGVYANLMAGVFIEKKTRVIPLVIGAAALVNVVGNGLLVPRYGYMASAWLTVASYAMMAGLMLLYIAPRYPVPYEWRRIGTIAFTVALAWVAGQYLIPEGWELAGQLVLLLLLPFGWLRALLEARERAGLKRLLLRR